MFVVGATHPEKFKEIRTIAPNHFLLVPGVGAQGGSLEEVSKYGLNATCGLLINSSAITKPQTYTLHLQKQEKRQTLLIFL